MPGTRVQPIGPSHRDDYEERYGAAIASFQGWKELTSSNNQWLADQVGVSCSSVTNFLNRKPGYEPRPGRSAMLRILETIEELEGRSDVINELDLEARLAELEGDDPVSEARRYAVVHAARARAMRGTNPLLRSRTDTLVLYMEALHAPPMVRPYMAGNLLVTMTTFLDKPESRHLERATLQTTVRQASRLDREIDATAAEALGDFPRGPSRAYLGYVLGFAGLHLADHGLVGEGVEILLEATSMPRFPNDGVWANTLRLMDTCLARRLPEATLWSTRTAQRADTDRGPALEALSTKTLRSIDAHWNEIAPELITASRALKGEG